MIHHCLFWRRTLWGFIAFACCAGFSPAQAQVVIEERVEIAPYVTSPDSARTPGGLDEGDPAARNSTIPGRGYEVIWAEGQGTSPVPTQTLTVTTNHGRSYTFSGSALTPNNQRQCDCNSDAGVPSSYDYFWSGGPAIYTSAEALRVPLDEGETVGCVSDGVTQQGYLCGALPPPNATPVPSFPEPDVEQGDGVRGLGFGFDLFDPEYDAATYKYANGCVCKRDGGAFTRSVLQGRAEFFVAPPEQLLVEAVPEEIEFAPSLPHKAKIEVQAAYADGAPAPWDGTLTFTASSTAYGSLVKLYCYYGCGVRERGGTLEDVRYSSRYKVYYYTDGDRGDGGAPATAGPVCDTDVRVSVSGGGLSGETVVTIRGSGPPPANDTLHVWTSPSSLAAGDSASVYAQHFKAGCLGEEMPDSTITSFFVSTVGYGSLEFEGQRGPLMEVLYGQAKAGAVRFIADGEKPLYDEVVEVTGTADALSGVSDLMIAGGLSFEPCNTGDLVLDDPEVQRLFRELWAASNYHDVDDPEGSPNPVEERLERLGVIVADGGSVTQAFAAPPGWYTDANSQRLDAVIRGSYDADDVIIHTHPMAVGERDPFNPFDKRYESKASGADFTQLDKYNDRFGMEDQLIIDADNIFFHDRSRQSTKRYPRCGY